MSHLAATHAQAMRSLLSKIVPPSLQVRQVPHARFTRQGDDLVAGVRLPLTRALCGGSIDVPALDNRVLRIPLKEVVTPGYERVVKGEGMPLSKQPGARGDLRIRFELEFPKRQLTGDEAANLEGLLADKYR